MTAIPNQWRLFFITKHLLKRIPPPEMTLVLKKAIAQGAALGLIVDIMRTIEDYLSKPEKSHADLLAQIDEIQFNELKAVIIDRLCNFDQQQLLTIPDLDLVIHLWLRWAGREIVSSRIGPIVASDSLPLLLEKYLRFGTTQGMGDRVARRIPRLNPKHLEPFTDITTLEPRVEHMLLRTDLTTNQRTAGEQFLKSMERIRQGIDPEGFFSDD